MHLRSFITNILLVVCLLSLSSVASAIKVTQSGKGAVIVDLEGNADVKVGDRFYTVVDGKKKGIVQISAIKGNKAKAKVLKGVGNVGATLTPMKSAGQARKKDDDSDSGGGGGALSDLTWGVLVGYSLDSQDVNATSTSASAEGISMTGSGYSLKAFGDWPISGSLGLIVRAGVETFNVKGSSNTVYCGSSRQCDTAITYLSGDALVRYFFTEGFWSPYAAGGLGLHYPLSKSSNVLDVSRIAMTTVFFLTLGSNFNISESSYIPVQVEYGLFPPSNDVKTSIISVRAGYGLKF